MKNNPFYFTLVSLRVLVIAVVVLCTRGAAGQEKILYGFKDIPDGQYPGYGRLISDSAGNLYGTTISGGNGSCQGTGCGTVFELSPQSGGGWTETILHSFQNNGYDGVNPYFGVAIDITGNLFGTTRYGGDGGCTGEYQPNGCGTIFELSPQPDGTWKERRLHDFKNGGRDGTYPYAPVILDSAGNLYGTTLNGGDDECYNSNGCGIIFELSQSGIYEVLHRFHGGLDDGVFPLGALTFDSSGNLYGTTEEGGDGNACDSGCGTVFELSPKPEGGWRRQLLYSFSGIGDVYSPNGDLILDAAGSLYGTAYLGIQLSR